MNSSREATLNKYRFLVDLYVVTDTGKVKCTNDFFNKYLRGLYSKYKEVLTWEDVLSVAMYETVKYLDKFELKQGTWEDMIEGTDIKNLNKFYSGLKTAVNFAVFWEANPTTVQKRKNKTKTTSAYSYYIDMNLLSLDINTEEETKTIQDKIGEENKLSYAKSYETEQLYSLAVFIMDEDNRKKHFTPKFNERYELLKRYHIDNKEDKKEFLKVAGLNSGTAPSNITHTMRKSIERVVSSLGIEEERVIPNEKKATNESLLYYEYFDLLNSLEPEEELTELSKWLRERELELEETLYTYLNFNQSKELTRLYKQSNKTLGKGTLYAITNIIHKELEKKVAYLMEVGERDRTVIQYEITEQDYREFRNSKLQIDSSGMIRT